MNIIDLIENEQKLFKQASFRVGCLIEIIEKDDMLKKKIKYFSGIVISFKKKKKFNSTIKVRKITKDGSAEKTFFLHSPNIKKISIIKTGKVRKSKLFYTRKNKLGLSKIFKKKNRRGA